MPREIRKWARLPSTILADIADRLTFSADHSSFRSVCPFWRSATSGKPQLPHILVPRHPNSNTCSLFSLADNITHDFPLPAEAIGKRVCGSSHGWLAFVDDEHRSVILCNPIRQDCIQLPPMTYGWTVPSFLPDGSTILPDQVDIRSPWRIWKLIFSANPAADPNSCVVAALIYEHGEEGDLSKLAICRLNDQWWTILAEKHGEFLDAAFYNTKLFALDQYWGLFIYDTAELTSSWMCQFARLPQMISQGYLLISEGELLVVMRIHPYNGCFNCGGKFVIYKLDSEMMRPVQIEMASLGNMSLFVGLNYTLSLPLPPADIPGCRRDCIYFTNFPKLRPIDDTSYERASCKDFGLFDVKEQRREALPVCSVIREVAWLPSIWITPSLI